MGKSTNLESLVRLCDAIETIYTRDNLRKPMPRDLQRLLQKAEARGFLCIIGSIDYMHWQLKNFPIASQRRLWEYEGPKKYYSRSRCITRYLGLGMPFSKLRDLKMTLTSSVNPQCSMMC
ncbi:unnamed protein product [Prunus armeniaca]